MVGGLDVSQDELNAARARAVSLVSGERRVVWQRVRPGRRVGGWSCSGGRRGGQGVMVGGGGGGGQGVVVVLVGGVGWAVVRVRVRSRSRRDFIFVCLFFVDW